MLGGTMSREELCARFVEDARRIWGDRLMSVILYGSAAREDFVSGRSDLNFLLVALDFDPETLRQLQPIMKKWRRRRIATPLLLERQLIATSLDSYPLEFLSMSGAYRVLHGEDVLAGLEFKRDDVRLQCERELKSKLLLLREAYVDSAGARVLLHGLIGKSLPAMTAIFQGLLFLQGRPWKLSGEDLLAAGKEGFDLDQELFTELWRVKRGRSKPGGEETHRLLGGYIREMERLAGWADRGGIGDRPRRT